MVRTRETAAPARLAASLAVAAAVLAATRAAAWEPDGPAQATMRADGAWAEVEAQADGVGLIHAAVDIAAPPKLVWRIMTDCRETPKLITSADPCRVLSADPAGAWDVREQVTHGDWIVPTIHNVYRSDYQPYSLIRFHKVGGDLKVEDGEWRLEPLNGGRATRVIYVNRVPADIHAPAGLVRAGLRSDTPKGLLNLRRECLAAGTVLSWPAIRSPRRHVGTQAGSCCKRAKLRRGKRRRHCLDHAVRGGTGTEDAEKNRAPLSELRASSVSSAFVQGACGALTFPPNAPLQPRPARVPPCVGMTGVGLGISPADPARSSVPSFPGRPRRCRGGSRGCG